MTDTRKIQNSHMLTDIFGKFPSFHDAEVHQINLTRGETRSFNPMLTAVINVFEMTSQIDEKNHCVLKNNVLVEFHFSRVRNLELVNFNNQNVLQYLQIKQVSDANDEKTDFDVLFEGIFGVSISFRCEAILIKSVTPFEKTTV